MYIEFIYHANIYNKKVNNEYCLRLVTANKIQFKIITKFNDLFLHL